jgi:hypothetical protein
MSVDLGSPAKKDKNTGLSGVKLTFFRKFKAARDWLLKDSISQSGKGSIIGRSLSVSAMILLPIIAVWLSAVCLGELSRRDWFLEYMNERIEDTRKSYDSKKTALISNKSPDFDAQLTKLDSEQQIVVGGLVEIQRRALALIYTGSNRISRTITGMTEIMELYSHAELIPDDHFKRVLGEQWQKPEDWNKETAVRSLVVGTSFRLVGRPDEEVELWKYWKQKFKELSTDFPYRFSSDSLLHVLAISYGIVGAYLGIVTTSIKFNFRKIAMGAIFGLLTLFLVKSGANIMVFSLQSKETLYNPYTISIVAFLSGLFQERFRNFLVSFLPKSEEDKKQQPGGTGAAPAPATAPVEAGTGG